LLFIFFFLRRSFQKNFLTLAVCGAGAFDMLLLRKTLNYF
jgi:hypothetical protein